MLLGSLSVALPSLGSSKQKSIWAGAPDTVDIELPQREELEWHRPYRRSQYFHPCEDPTAVGRRCPRTLGCAVHDALGKAAPDRIPAQGMNATTGFFLSRRRPGGVDLHLDIVGGGWGAAGESMPKE